MLLYKIIIRLRITRKFILQYIKALKVAYVYRAVLFKLLAFVA
jgi:hypothetical protein